MKIRSVLVATIVLAAIWPAIAEAQHRGGGGGGGGGGGRAAAGAHMSRGAAVRAAPRASFNRSAVHVRSRSAAHVQNRATLRARNATRASSRHAIANTGQRAKLANTKAERRAQAVERRAQAGQRRAHAAQLQAKRQAARQARFAARFNNAERRRFWRGPARWAWRHGWYAGYVGWYGPLFWPYAYADLFYWTFWPWGYAPGYWYYAYDDFFDGVFYGSAPAPAPVGYARRGGPTTTSYAQAQDLCKQPTDGVTAWPVADIERAIQPTDEQRQLLAQLKDVSQQAAQKFAVACPAENDLAGTAPGRLATIIGRLKATEDVIVTVKPAFDAFYSSLTDEQKTRFDTLGPKEQRVAARTSRTTTGAANQQADRCGNVNAGLTDLPMQQIELTVRPTQEQQDAFKQFQEATAKAVQHLQANCPQETAATPAARLDAMQANVRAMIEAAETIQPALEKFYATLEDPQKTRFNKLDKKMASVE